MEFEHGITYLELTPSEFWELTPAEFYAMADGFSKRQKQRTNELIYLAWNTAALTRIEKMPELKDLYETVEPKKEQTDDDMLTVAKSLNAAFGGEVVYQ